MTIPEIRAMLESFNTAVGVAKYTAAFNLAVAVPTLLARIDRLTDALRQVQWGNCLIVDGELTEMCPACDQVKVTGFDHAPACPVGIALSEEA